MGGKGIGTGYEELGKGSRRQAILPCDHFPLLCSIPLPTIPLPYWPCICPVAVFITNPVVHGRSWVRPVSRGSIVVF